MPPDPNEEEISAFDAAAYIFQLAGQLGRMAHEAGFLELAKLLHAARERASEDLAALTRAVQPKPPKPAPGEAT